MAKASAAKITAQNNPLIPGSKANRALAQNKGKNIRPMSPKMAKQYNAAAKAYKPSISNEIQQQKASESGVLGDLGGVWKEAKTFGKQAVAFPKDTMEGIGAVARAGANDITHPMHLIDLEEGNPSKSQLGKLGMTAIKNDPIVKSITSGSLAPIKNNPFGVAMDLTGAGSIPLKAADAVGAVRAAGESGEAGDLGSYGRAIGKGLREGPARPSQKLEGSDFQVLDHKYSQNPFVRAGQKIKDNPKIGDAGEIGSSRETLGKIGKTLRHPIQAKKGLNTSDISQALRRAADEDFAMTKQAEHSDLADIIKQVRGPRGKNSIKLATAKLPTEDIVGHMRQGVGSVEDLKNILRNEVAKRQDTLRKADEGKIKLLPAERQQLHTSLDNLQHHLLHTSDEELQQGIDVANAHGAIAHSQSTLKRELGLTSPEIRDVLPYAQNRLGAVKGSTLEGLERVAKPGASAFKDAKDNLEDAIKDRDAIKDGSHEALKEERRSVSAKTRMAIKNPSPATRAARDEAIKALKDRQQELLPAAKEAVAQARAEVKGAKPEGGIYEKGWLTRNAEGNLEPLDVKAVQQHMRENGVNPETVGYAPTHVPEEESLTRQQRFSPLGKGKPPLNSKGPKYSGKAVAKGTDLGDERTSLEGLTHSNKQIHNKLMWRRAIKRMNVGVFPEGDDHAIAAAADAYAHRTGLQVQAQDFIDDSGERKVALMPADYMDRIAQHTKVDESTNGLTAFNNAFRAGVLPASANYFASIIQEGAFRGLFNGRNPIKTAGLYGGAGLRRVNQYVDAAAEKMNDASLTPAARADWRDLHNQLKAMTSSGTQFGTYDRDLQRTLSHSNPKTSDIAKAARSARDIVYWPGQKMLKAAHTIENRQVAAVAGPWLKDIERIHGGMEQAMEAMSQGKDAANLRSSLSHEINDVLGRYLVRSPAEQRIIRDVIPFFSWAQNAAKFVLVTMPKDKPLLTSVMYNLGAANAKAWASRHNIPSSFMTDVFGTEMGSAGESMWGRDVFRNTPYGIAEEDPSEMGTMVAPELTAPLFGTLGLNAFGKPVEGSKYGQTLSDEGAGPRLLQAVKNDTSMVPYFGAIQKGIKAATGTQSASEQISKQKGLAIIENVLGGSLIKHDYSMYNKPKAKASTAKSGFSSGNGFRSGSGFSSGGGFSSGSGF